MFIEPVPTLKRLMLASAAIMLLATSAYAAGKHRAAPRVSTAPAVAAANGLGERVFAHEVLKAPNATVVVSPLNVGRAMISLGQGSAGRTKREFSQALGLPRGVTMQRLAQSSTALARDLAGQKDLTVTMAGSVWLDRTIRPGVALKPRALRTSGISFYSTSFARPGASDRINAWVADKTRGRITDIVKDLRPDTALVLADALYFKADWTRPFDPALTRKRDFHLANGESVPVRMMHRTGKIDYAGDETVQVAALPFAGGRMEFRVALPREGAAMPTDPVALAAWLAGVRDRELDEERGELALPKLELDWSGDLMASLSAAGLDDAMGARADYRQFAKTRLAVSQVSHKVVFHADETGAEGAAATAVVMTRSMSIGQPFEMVVDHPFFLFVRDTVTGAILFEARVGDPGTRAKD